MKAFWIVLRVFMAAAFMGAAFPLVAAAEDGGPDARADICAVTRGAFVEEVRKNVQIELRIMQGEEAEKFLDAFNNMPPVSQIESDEIVIGIFDDGRSVGIAFFANSCYRNGIVVPRQVYDLAMALAFGQKS